MIETTVLTSRTATGAPHVTIGVDRGDLQIYPAGILGGTALFISPADWDVLCAAVVVARGVQPPNDLLRLANAVNEAAFAYRETLDGDVTGYDDVFTAGRILLTAVDALTGAVVEAENDRAWNR